VKLTAISIKQSVDTLDRVWPVMFNSDEYHSRIS